MITTWLLGDDVRPGVVGVGLIDLHLILVLDVARAAIMVGVAMGNDENFEVPGVEAQCDQAWNDVFVYVEGVVHCVDQDQAVTGLDHPRSVLSVADIVEIVENLGRQRILQQALRRTTCVAIAVDQSGMPPAQFLRRIGARLGEMRLGAARALGRSGTSDVELGESLRRPHKGNCQ